jgi:hypothetical protein
MFAERERERGERKNVYGNKERKETEKEKANEKRVKGERMALAKKERKEKEKCLQKGDRGDKYKKIIGPTKVNLSSYFLGRNTISCLFYKAPASLANIILGFKDFPGISTMAYFLGREGKKTFITLNAGTRYRIHNSFSS